MPISKRFSSRLIAGLAAGWLCLMSCSTEAEAGHCGCEPSCQVCPPPHVECGCQCNHGRKVNCVKKAFDRFTLGIEKLFSFGKSGCDDLLCDDACDAAMLDELMIPMAPPVIHHHPHGAHQHDAHSHHAAPSMPPQIQTRLSQARPSQPGEPGESYEGEMPPPIRSQEPNPDRGSLFDTESDPFGDDEASVRTQRPVRPSAYHPVELRPIESRQPVRQSARQRSSR
jgi:hypothetical protein